MVWGRPRAIIFDFNGVIVDDEPLHLELFRRVLNEEGLDFTEDEYREKYLGCDDRGCFALALSEAGRAGESRDERLILALVGRKSAYYQKAIRGRSLLFPGAAELVRRSAERYPLALVSGALRNEIEPALQTAGIREFFEAIVASEDVGACKPDPEGYLRALAELNRTGRFDEPLRAGECLVIEDSIAGVRAAKSAGMFCIAITGSYNADELREAHRVAGSLAEIGPDWF